MISLKPINNRIFFLKQFLSVKCSVYQPISIRDDDSSQLGGGAVDEEPKDSKDSQRAGDKAHKRQLPAPDLEEIDEQSTEYHSCPCRWDAWKKENYNL